jgi:carbonic anhydrase
MNSKYILIVFSFLFTSTFTFLPLRCIGDDPPPQWSYKGLTGPKSWGTLTIPSISDYWLASYGKNQSPVDIDISSVLKVVDNLPTVEYNYSVKSSDCTILNNGHTVKVTPPQKVNWIEINNKRYDLLQFHFHSQSEHTLNGRFYSMEAHFVHQADDDELAVIAWFITPGDKNPQINLAPIWNNIPAQLQTKTLSFNINSLFLTNKPPYQYYQYNGSLTTPPCSEGVRWFVRRNPVEMSQAQIDVFRAVYNGNHRPVQPLNARQILSTP